jgi:hypothetical protein
MAVEARNKTKAIHPLIACPDLVCSLGVHTWIEELQATGVYSIRFGNHAMAVAFGDSFKTLLCRSVRSL